jgi:hypothetical protein
MKGTTTSCTIIGALIVTIMFAITFSVPDGNKQETGYLVFLDEKVFMLFIISNALLLFFAITSVLMLLGIPTSCYARDNFLESLPRKMIIGLSTLFLFHYNHDDSLLCYSFNYATRTIMNNHSCHLFG